MIEKILEYIKPKRKVLFLTHDNPDPDSISSAFALKNLLFLMYKKRCTIGYRGIIGRSQNRELVRVCNIKMFNTSLLNPTRYECVILVDCQPNAGNVFLPGSRLPDIVIDHHYIRSYSKKVKIKDIRPKVGSTCTIITEYYKKLNILPDKNTATALYYGMKTDTIGTARSNTKLDLDMMSYITPYISLRKLSKIEEPEIPKYYYKNLLKVLEKMELIEDLIFCDIGEVRNADLIAEMSDFLLRMRDVKWTFVIGYINKMCYFSLRCKLTRKIVGGIAAQITKDIGSGGGHLKSAGGQIPLVNNDYKDIILLIKKRLLHILNKGEAKQEVHQ